MSNVCISLCLLFLLNGFESVLIETHLYSIFPTDTSYFTIAKFNTPSQMTCIHKCLRLSSKMFYNNNDGGLCVCFNDSNEKAGNLYEKKSSDLERNKGVVMEVIKSHYTQVIYFQKHNFPTKLYLFIYYNLFSVGQGGTIHFLNTYKITNKKVYI